MLEEITVKNLGIIKEAKLSFSPGLSVITGETGAGKSLILNSLGLLTGKRADSKLVAPDAQQACVEGSWFITNSDFREKIEETGAELEDDNLLFITRTLTPEGKARAILGGRTTPTKVLASFGENLVNIHGQADQLRLRDSSAQLEALDTFGGSKIESAKKTYLNVYKQWQVKKKALKELSENFHIREAEYLALTAFFEEYEALAPQAGELEELSQTIETLSHIDSLREAMGSVLGILASEDFELTPPVTLLDQAARALSKVASFDETLNMPLEELHKAIEFIDSATTQLENYSETLDGDKLNELYHAQERMQALQAFAKKYRSTLPQLEERALKAEARLRELNPENNNIEALEEEVQALQDKVWLTGEKLSETRQQAGSKLAKAVNKELSSLAMAGNIFKVLFVPLASPTFSGIDEVAFTLQAPGAPTPRPIAKAASGGELSRVMLALEVVLADPTKTPTFVFDEVDSGIGGATAIAVGERLAALAKEAQVIVVTHLPQVACFGDQHLKVVKTATSDATVTTVETLNEKERVVEITRMLSGLSDSAHGKAHAQELLELAAVAKSE